MEVKQKPLSLESGYVCRTVYVLRMKKVSFAALSSEKRFMEEFTKLGNNIGILCVRKLFNNITIRSKMKVHFDYRTTLHDCRITRNVG